MHAARENLWDSPLRKTALAAADAGADLLGLIFVPQSKRYVTLAQAGPNLRPRPRLSHMKGCAADTDTPVHLRCPQTCRGSPPRTAPRIIPQPLPFRSWLVCFRIKAWMRSYVRLRPPSSTRPVTRLGTAALGPAYSCARHPRLPHRLGRGRRDPG